MRCDANAAAKINPKNYQYSRAIASLPGTLSQGLVCVCVSVSAFIQYIHTPRSLLMQKPAAPVPTAPHATSAISGVSVAEIRSALANLRSRAAAATPKTPVWLCDVLCHDLTVAEFCLQFVLGQHIKRHAKSQAHAQNLECARSSAQSQSHLPEPAVGPKGFDKDPFPFTPRWTPRTAAGRRAFGLDDVPPAEPASSP
jgi:hypothetical protein